MTEITIEQAQNRFDRVISFYINQYRISWETMGLFKIAFGNLAFTKLVDAYQNSFEPTLFYTKRYQYDH